MDPVLRGSPTRHSACFPQVDVRPFFLPPTHQNVIFHDDLNYFRYKDFSECFPLWCEEQPSGAEGVFNTVSNFIETHIVVRVPFFLPTSPQNPLTWGGCFFLLLKDNTNKLFEEYDVQKNLDTLHQVVTEARERRQRGESSGAGAGAEDLWRADLQPRTAVRARTVPALERERDALRARLADVRPFVFPCLPEP